MGLHPVQTKLTASHLWTFGLHIGRFSHRTRGDTVSRPAPHSPRPQPKITAANIPNRGKENKSTGNKGSEYPRRAQLRPRSSEALKEAQNLVSSRVPQGDVKT